MFAFGKQRLAFFVNFILFIIFLWQEKQDLLRLEIGYSIVLVAKLAVLESHKG